MIEMVMKVIHNVRRPCLWLHQIHPDAVFVNRQGVSFTCNGSDAESPPLIYKRPAETAPPKKARAGKAESVVLTILVHSTPFDTNWYGNE
jgi:hypothetical protein